MSLLYSFLTCFTSIKVLFLRYFCKFFVCEMIKRFAVSNSSVINHEIDLRSPFDPSD